MPRYGGGQERFGEEKRLLDQLGARASEIAAKERAAAEAADSLAGAEQKATTSRTLRNRAAREGAALDAREAQVAEQDARAVNLSTEAIQRNAAARRARAAAARQEAVDMRLAAAGARDPAFGRAYGLAQEGQVSQYRLRQQLGVGQGRAARLQAAVESGAFRPAGAAARPLGPLTQVQAAALRVEQAEAQLAQATRQLTNVRRSASVGDAERLEAREARNAAAAARDAARLELQSAEQLAAARQTAARETLAGGPGRGVGAATDIIRHPTLYGGTRASTTVEATGRSATDIGNETNAVRANTQAHEQRARAVGAAEAAQYRAGLRATVTQNVAQQTANTQMLTRTLQSEGAALGSLGNRMMRHGALSSEFIEATARGEVSLRELGNQALITAGKFGGWTLAATAVYGLARAFGELGRGAIDANLAVNKLQQVLPHVDVEKAHRQVIALSRQYNVSFAQVGDALQESAKHVNNQSAAFQLAGTALGAEKVFPDLNADNTIKGLTAITRGFHEPLEQSREVMDQLVVLSSRFGVSASDSLVGAAKAAAVFAQAGGGGTKELLAMVGAMNRLGYSSNEAGTAIRRSAEILRRPGTKNRKLLQAFGIDSDQPYGDVIRQAVGLVQSGQVKGRDVNRLATALSTPQLSSRFAAILNRPDIYGRMLHQLGGPDVEGAFGRRVHTALQSVQQQIEQIGHALQRMGAALATAGAGASLVLLLHTLNLILNTTTDIIGVFNQIPAPIRTALTLMGELALAMRALRRFGTLDARFPAFGRSRGDVVAGRVEKGLRDERDASVIQAESSRRRARTVSSAAVTADQTAIRAEQQAQENAAAAAAGNAAALDRQVAMDERAVRARQEATRLAEQGAAASAAATDETAIAAAAEKRLTQFQEERAVNAAKAAAAAEAAGISAPLETTAGSTRGVRPTPQEQRGARYIPTTFQPVALEEGVGGAAAQEEQLTRLQQRANRMSDRLRNFAASGESAWLSARAMRAGAGRAAGVVERGATAIRDTGNAVSGLAVRMRGFIAGIGPLEAAFIAFIAGEFIKDQLNSMWAKSDQQINSLSRNVNSRAALEFHRRAISRNLNPSKSGGQDVLETILGPLAYIPLAGKSIDEFTGRAAQRRIAERDRKTENEIIRAQREAVRTGHYVPLLTADQLEQAIQRDTQRRKDGLISLSVFDKRMANHAKELLHLRDASKDQVDTARQVLAGAQRQSGQESEYRASLRAMDPKGLQQEAQAVQALIQDMGPTRQSLTHLRDVYDAALHQLAGKHDAASVLALSQIRQQVYQTLEQSVQEELTTDLAYARTEDQRQAAYRKAGSTFRTQGLETSLRHQRDARKHLDEAQKKYDDALKAYQHDPNRITRLALGAIGLGGLAPGPDLKKKLDAALRNLSKARDEVNKSNEDVAYWRRKEKQYRAQIRDASYQDRQQGREITLGYQQSQTGDPRRQADEAIREAQQQVRDAAKTYGVGSRQWRQSMAALNQAEDQRDQAIMSSVEADNALLVARAGTDPIAVANAQVQAAVNTYEASLHARHPNPDTIKQNLAGVINAQNNRAQVQHQNAMEIAQLQGQIAQAQAAGHGDPVAEARAAQNAAHQMSALAKTTQERLQATLAIIQANNQMADALRAAAQAAIDLRESRTTDPVKQAHFEVLKARAALRGQTGAGRDTARAALNRAIQAERDAKLQGREQDIDFEQEMGRISIQDAIERYKALLHTRNLTKQQKRDIQLKIHGLQQQAAQEASGFDLDVGSIKLPTIYDVRRAFDPIRGAIKAARDHVKDITDPNQGGRTAELLHLRGHHRGPSHRDLADAGATVQAQVNVYVNDRHSVNAVYDALDRVMGTHVRSQLRSRGHRRVR